MADWDAEDGCRPLRARSLIPILLEGMFLPFISITLFLGTSTFSFGEGALAVDKRDIWSYGMTWNHRSQGSANREALNVCASISGSSRCQVVIRTSGECLAYAIDNRRSSGWATAWQLWQAEEEAVRQCEIATGSRCNIEYSACDGLTADQRYAD